MTILEQLSEHALERVIQAKEKVSFEKIKSLAYTLPKEEFIFERTLQKPDISFICECKKASPSKGVLAEEFPYLQIAKEYEDAGAECISVLTEPKWFLGKNEYLEEIAKEVSVPCLRKDFIVDDYMIYESKLLGASAVLLICSILSTDTMGEYIKICDSLGISALVEVHNEQELKNAIEAGARIIGVNNRNLNDFTIDKENSKRLRKLVPENIIFVAESGIETRKDIETLQKMHVDAVLIGETLMRAADRKRKLQELRGII